MSKQLQPFEVKTLEQDQKTLNKYKATLYPLFESLDRIIKDVIYANKSNSDLYNISIINIDKAKTIDRGNKSINEPILSSYWR